MLLRAVDAWRNSTLPLKMHISSPIDDKDIRAHVDYVDSNMFLPFSNEIYGSIDQIDCMIEANQKEYAIFKLMEDLKKHPSVENVNVTLKVRVRE